MYRSVVWTLSRPEEELDLFDLAAGVMTEAGASAPQIMGSDTGQTASLTGGCYH